MKKSLAILLLMVSIICNLVPLNTSAASTAAAYEEGIAYLTSIGVSERIISLMDETEICEYANAQSSQSTSSYYAYVYDKQTEENSIEVYTEAEYNSIMKTMQSRESNEKEYSWMLLTIISTNVSFDNYIILCEYEWLTDPLLRYTDVVAITFDSRMVSQTDTGAAKMGYTNSDGSNIEIDYDSCVTYSSEGVYAGFDIPGLGNSDIYGYMSTRAKINNLTGTVSFNNWAYYAHKTGIFSGIFSVSFPGDGEFTISPSGSFNVVDVGLLSTYTP